MKLKFINEKSIVTLRGFFTPFDKRFSGGLFQMNDIIEQPELFRQLIIFHYFI